MNSFHFYKHITSQINSNYELNEVSAVAFILMKHYFGMSKESVIAGNDVKINKEQKELLDAAIKRLNRHEPVQYITGRQEFYGRIFKVNPSVLIPRPETEGLVRLVTEEQNGKSVSILDIGCGSGCIAITLDLELPLASLIAIDSSLKALELAKENTLSLNAFVEFMNYDLFEPTNQLPLADIWVSNPPYVIEGEKKLMRRRVLDYEPSVALFVRNDDPLIYYQKILQLAEHCLKPDGIIYFEINEKFGKEISLLFQQFKYSNIRILRDLQNKDRYAVGTKPLESHFN